MEAGRPRASDRGSGGLGLAEGIDSKLFSHVVTDSEWTIGDVIRGIHRGGTAGAAPPIFGNAQQQAKQIRDRDKRRAKLSSTLTPKRSGLF